MCLSYVTLLYSVCYTIFKHFKQLLSTVIKFLFFEKGLEHKLRLSEQNQNHLDKELRDLSKERADLNERLALLTRQKNALAEELISTRRDEERQSDNLLHLAKEKEDLIKDKAELVVQITGCEKENRQQGEVGCRQYNDL